MGHIANKIDAKDKKLSEVLTGQRYRIDAFQREYRWQRKHIDALISDLALSFLKNYKEGDTFDDKEDYDCYYMGPIVLCNDKGVLSIVDGQQRLTSFTLLLIYLLHAQTKLKLKDDLLIDLKPYLYVTKSAKTTLVLNVTSRNKIIQHLYNNPDSVFSEPVELESSNLDSENLNNKMPDESIQNIIERYEDISKGFPDELKNSEILPLFIDWLLDKVIMVEVKAYSMENAYTIFETMNDRGLSLNPTEILKGFLLSKIEDDKQSEELNEFWKERITEIKAVSGIDSDLDFFRAWLRAKYAETIRQTKQGSENEDFEIIGTQFHTWVKNNSDKTFLKNPNDYYFFIRSDFDFFSTLYKNLYSYKNEPIEGFDEMYISNFYPIADSLAYPLLISPISKIDEDFIIEEKIKIVGKFIDVYVNTRTMLGKAITQSSIRYTMYELVKTIRNLDINILKEKLSIELDKYMGRPYSAYHQFHEMDNWGYYHYFFARILYHLDDTSYDFYDLLRSKKRNSFVLFKIFSDEEIINDNLEILPGRYFNCVANFCLVKRNDLEKISSFDNPIKKLSYLITQNYLPEINTLDLKKMGVTDFIELRDLYLKNISERIWYF
jgi:uncharacterized protein with ParB-like and HNH nuclease domain